jgi:hypothetical protein
LLKPAKKQDRTTMGLLFIAALVAVGGIGFAVGHLTAPTSTAANPNGFANGRGGFARPSLAPGQTFSAGQFGGGGAGGFRGGLGGSASVSGTVQSIDGSKLTLKLANGNTVTIDLSGSTTYHNETAATSGDVQTGSTVTVQIDTAGSLVGGPNAGASGAPNGGAPGGQQRTLTAKDVLITTP